MARHLSSEYSNEVKVNVLAGGTKIGGVPIPDWVIALVYIIIVLILIGVLLWLIRKWLKAQKEKKLAIQKLELLSEEDPKSEVEAQDTNVGAEAEAKATG